MEYGKHQSIGQSRGFHRNTGYTYRYTVKNKQNFPENRLSENTPIPFISGFNPILQI